MALIAVLREIPGGAKFPFPRPQILCIRNSPYPKPVLHPLNRSRQPHSDANYTKRALYPLQPMMPP